MRLSLIRHPKALVAAGICYGRSDVDVDAQEVTRLLPLLQPLCVGHGALFSSPLQRCLRLADLLGLAVQRDDRLREIDFGAWEMQPWNQIARAEIDAWAADVVHYPVGGHKARW